MRGITYRAAHKLLTYLHNTPLERTPDAVGVPAAFALRFAASEGWLCHA